MANTNEYIDEAYNTLLRLSADDKKRMEYEARQKAIRDYNSQMDSAENRGKKAGIAIGEKIGEERGITIGEKIGEERYNQLVLKLIESGESEILKKAAKDIEFRKELYGKYNIE